MSGPANISRQQQSAATQNGLQNQHAFSRESSVASAVDSQNGAEQQPTGRAGKTDYLGVQVEDFIKTTLKQNSKARMLLLKLELVATEFLNDAEKQSLRFLPAASYQRMLIHRVATLFGFEHNVDSTRESVVISKTTRSSVPVGFRFRDFVPTGQDMPVIANPYDIVDTSYKEVDGDDAKQVEADEPANVSQVQHQHHGSNSNGRSINSIWTLRSEHELTSSSASAERRSVTSSLSSSASSSFTSLDDSIGGHLDLQKSSGGSASSSVRATSASDSKPNALNYQRRLSDTAKRFSASRQASNRMDDVNAELECEPWFFADFDRKQAEAVLTCFGEEASFLVRFGSNQTATTVLSPSAMAESSASHVHASANRSSSLTCECEWTPFAVSILHYARVHHLQVRKLCDASRTRYALGRPKANELTFESVSALIAHQRHVGLILLDESNSMLLGKWPPKMS